MNNRRKQLMLASAKEYCKCVVEGKTLKYNQLFDIDTNTNFSYGTQYNGITLTKQNGRIIINGTSTDFCNFLFYFPNVVKGGHKYFRINLRSNGLGMYDEYEIDDASVVVAESDNDYLSMTIKNGKTFDNYIFNGTFIDLTELGLDSVNSVADFYETDLGKYIAKGNYLPYESEGKFIHAQSPINFKGVNIWNEQWENGIWYYGSKLTSGGYANFLCSKDKIKVYPNTQYFYYCGTGRTGDYIQLEFYDKSGNTIQRLIKNNNSAFTTPNNCYSMAFYINDSYGTTYNHDICINEYNENYNGKYYKYCGNSVFESGLTLQKGDAYKSWGLDDIEYNNQNSMSNGTITGWQTIASASVIGGHKYLVYAKYSRPSNAPYQDTDYQVFITDLESSYIYDSNATPIFIATCAQSGTCEFNSATYDNFADAVNYQIMLIDLTLLGLDNIASVEEFNKTKLGMFLSKGYYLPYTITNKTIKDQIVRTMVEIDLSTLTWTYNSYINAWQSDLSSLFVKSYSSNVLPSAIAEKYRTIKYSDFSNAVEGDMWLFSIKPVLEIKSNDSVNSPSGKALLELETSKINVWYHLEINDYHEWEQYNGSVYKLDRDLSDLNVFGITADIGVNQGGLLFLLGRGNYNDYCYEDGYIYVKTDDIQNVWAFDLLINNLPNRMVSRRTINVESNNGIDLDFTKE